MWFFLGGEVLEILILKLYVNESINRKKKIFSLFRFLIYEFKFIVKFLDWFLFSINFLILFFNILVFLEELKFLKLVNYCIKEERFIMSG